MQHAQQTARALLEADALMAFVTTYVYRESGLLALLLKRLSSDLSARLARELARRTIDEIPPDLVHCYPLWEILRSGAQKAGANVAIVDALWDRLSQSFDAVVARRHVLGAEAIHGFEYTSLASFQ